RHHPHAGGDSGGLRHRRPEGVAMRWLGRKRIRQARGAGNLGGRDTEPTKARTHEDDDRTATPDSSERPGAHGSAGSTESPGMDDFASDTELPEGNSLPEISLRRPVSVLVATAALLVLGLVSVTRLKLDFLPQMDFPFLGI